MKNEQFSSNGPALHVFNPDGTRLAAPQFLQKPDVSGARRQRHLVLHPGGQLQTTNPPLGTGPATPTELDGNAVPQLLRHLLGRARTWRPSRP